MNRYDVGDAPQVTATFRDLTDTPTDPTTVTATMAEPDGTITTLGGITNPATGVYSVELPVLDQPGRHTVKFFGTGSLIAAEEVEFDVRTSRTIQWAGGYPLPLVAWDDLRVPLTATKVGPLSPPDFAQWRDDGAGSTGVFAYHFSPTALEQVYFDAQLPHSYKQGSEIHPHVHYVLPTAPSAGQTLVFGLEYTWCNVNGTAPTTTTLYATETFTGSELANTQYIAGFDPDIAEATMKVSAMISCRLFRDATNDTYPADAIVLEADFHYQADALGSRTEFVK